MSWVRGGLILLMLLSASFAAVAEAGNWAATETGNSNTTANAATRCGPDVQAVYACSGDTVKAVSSDGSTFYKPDGRIITCPNAAPTQIGAECVQLLMPNYCPTQVTCEAVQDQNAPVGAPGNVTNGTVSVANGSSEAPAPVTAAAKAPTVPAATANKEDIVLPAAAPSTTNFSMDNLALVVLLLGAVSVGVLFTMFKNSISE
jgi:hypothetical protein